MDTTRYRLSAVATALVVDGEALAPERWWSVATVILATLKFLPA